MAADPSPNKPLRQAENRSSRRGTVPALAAVLARAIVLLSMKAVESPFSKDSNDLQWS
jgi:hypothetical protein